MRHTDLDGLVDSLIDDERTVPLNPFLATRIMGIIRGESPGRRVLIPIWQGMAMALSFILVIALGIKAGYMYKTTEPHSNATSVMITSDDNMEHFEFYRQTSKE